jgi:hypothetical protein
MDSFVVNTIGTHAIARWNRARKKVEQNNRILQETSEIEGTRNRAAASFEGREPIVGFRAAFES